MGAANILKLTSPAANRVRAAWSIRRGGAWRGESHECGELLDVAVGIVPIKQICGGKCLGLGGVVRYRRELARCSFIALRLEEFVADSHLDVVGFATVH